VSTREEQRLRDAKPHYEMPAALLELQCLSKCFWKQWSMTAKIVVVNRSTGQKFTIKDPVTVVPPPAS
jgi:hypothetical protein